MTTEEVFSQIRQRLDRAIDNALDMIGERLRGETQKLLRGKKKIAWKELFDSIVYRKERLASGWILHFGSNARHARWVSEGRPAGKMPPIEPIKRWVIQKGRLNPGLFKGGFERYNRMSKKQKAGKEAEAERAAWGVAIKIKHRGIKEFPFLTLIVNQEIGKINQILQKAVREM